MRTYDDVKEYVKKLKTSQDFLDATDLYDTSKMVTDAFDEYEKEYDSAKREKQLALLNAYIDKYEDLEKIYDQVSYAATKHPFDYTSYLDDSKDPVMRDRYLIEEILERVHMDSGLRRQDNEVHLILRETLGWYFNELDVIDALRGFLLKNATESILDEYAYQYGIVREDNESDASLRARIFAHIHEKYRVRDVKLSGIDLFTHVENPYTQLTSRNTYLSNKYLAHGEERVMDYWDKKYMTWRDITWF